jgi:hypothetical protein
MMEGLKIENQFSFEFSNYDDIMGFISFTFYYSGSYCYYNIHDFIKD